MRTSNLPPTITLSSGQDGLLTVDIIDQTLLPNHEKILRLQTVDEVCEAIKSLRVRGAPAIGCAAAAGVALCANRSEAASLDILVGQVEASIDLLAATRPTAVNLFWALARMRKVLRNALSIGTEGVRRLLEREARHIIADDLARCRAIGTYGAKLLKPGSRVLTHCNAGALATAGYGTALGVIRTGYDDGKVEMVWVDETRPLLQGARLTAWELYTDGIPCRVITDNMAAAVMQQGLVDAIVVGADRIASNGDTANKIGTYGLAVLAKYHGIPFYVAAPVSTVDFNIVDGEEIPIEERGSVEITHLGGQSDYPVVPLGVNTYNPAFDVTPNALISAIITDRGTARAPYTDALSVLGENLQDI